MVKIGMRSMTGYGRGSASSDGGTISVEIRAVNHRFLDLKIRGLQVSADVQEKLGALVRKHVERGSISLYIRSDVPSDSMALAVNMHLARSLHKQLRDLKNELQLTGEIDLKTIAAQPLVFTKSEARSESEEWVSAAQDATLSALTGLIEMREKEGQALFQDLVARLVRIKKYSDALSQIAAIAPSEAHQRLIERISKLKSNKKIEMDEARVAQEIALMADRMDVTEEVVRVDSHIKQFESLMKNSGGVGRRMDFLIQEFSREFNTIASKSQHVDAAKHVVEAKAELEKMREQVQNIE